MLPVNEVKGEMGEEGCSQWKRSGAWTYWRAGGVGLGHGGMVVGAEVPDMGWEGLR